MKQMSLPLEPQPTGLLCSFGTEFLDHFRPPIGTGKGCQFCETPFYGLKV